MITMKIKQLSPIKLRFILKGYSNKNTIGIQFDRFNKFKLHNRSYYYNKIKPNELNIAKQLKEVNERYIIQERFLNHAIIDLREKQKMYDELFNRYEKLLYENHQLKEFLENN